MPAESAAQQRLFGMALAAKRGKGSFSGKVQELANSMSAKKLKEFAKTKHEGLPEKKANMNTLQQAFVNGFVKRAAEYGVNEYQAIELLKQAAPQQIETQPGGQSWRDVAKKPNKYPPAQARPEPAPGVSALSRAESKRLRVPIPPGGTTEPVSAKK